MSRATYDTELGRGAVDYDAGGVTTILLPGHGSPRAPGAAPPRAVAHLVAALEAYYEGRASLIASPAMIESAGTTPLLRDIYRYVSSIRPGHTATYSDVAAAVGRPGAARAVGAAMARNPFPPVIPCHRVVGADGGLRGYGGGLDQKRHLLAMEGARA